MSQNDILSEIEEWISNQSYYIQYVAKYVLNNEKCDEEVIENAYKYFLEDENIKDKESIRDSITFSDTESTENEKYTDIKLQKIKNVENVNALSEGQRIDFGEELTVIYGKNGTGKTGYVRIMNQAFNARGDTKILQDISTNNTNDGNNPICIFEFNNEDEIVTIEYPEQDTDNILNRFSVFDNKCVKIHLSEENEFSFSPRGFEFFDGLMDAFNCLVDKIDNEIKNRKIDHDFLLHFQEESEIKEYIEELDSTSDLDKLKKYASISEDDEERLEELKKKYNKLKVKNFGDEIKKLNQNIKLLKKFKDNFLGLTKLFNDESIKEYKQLISQYFEYKNILEKEGVKRFETPNFRGIGSDTWKDFVKTANAFSKIQNTTEDHTYPTKGDLCIFCRQTLSQSEVTLINKYWDYLESTAESNFDNAKKSIKSELNKLDEIEIPNITEETKIGSWLKSRNEDRYNKLLNIVKTIAIDLNNLVSNLSEKEWVKKIESFNSPIKLIDEYIKNIKNNISNLEEQKDKYDKNLENLENQISFLEHKKKLNNLKTNIEKFVKNSRWIEQVEDSKPTSRFITTFQKSLFSKHITKKYKKIFNKECEALKVPFEVNIKQRGHSGSTLRQLKIIDYNPDNILSEGEQKAVSLADYLTEIQLDKDNCGIIFDDPVNSLDHERKGIIAKRLVKESQNRQVIIFTHDLVFLHKLKNASDNIGTNFISHWIRKENNKVGNVYLNNSPSLEKDYKTSKIARDFHKKAREAEPEKEQYFLKQGFAALRTSYEAFIIYRLFGRVVQRWDEVISFGRLKDVVIKDEIVEKVIDKCELLSRYIEGHLHSDKFKGSPPTPKLLIKEIEEFDRLNKKQKKIVKQHRKNNG